MDCAQCGQPFEPTRKWQKYCTKECRMAAWREGTRGDDPLMEPFEAPEPYDQIIRALQGRVRDAEQELRSQHTSHP